MNPDSDPDPDADPDPAIFVIDLPKIPTKNYQVIFLKEFLLITFLMYTVGMYIIFKD
jgi:hypothetical protein